jgi:glutaconate CoA-transferase subunit B
VSAPELGRDYSLGELHACLIAREFADGERVMLGANVGPGRAGVLLAHLHHAPNLRIMVGMSWSSFAGATSVPLAPGMADYRNARAAEAFLYMDVWGFELRNFGSDAFVVSGLQVDRFGNTNLIGLGEDHRRLRLRGPGPVGTTTATAYAKRFYIMPARHSPDVLVESCDFVSSVGWGEGGADGRQRLGLPGGGPALCITELCVFDFDEETKAMRVKSLHPGVSLDEVRARTGFEPVVPDSVPLTEPPREDELAVLRERVDPAGRLRGDGS